MNTTIDAADRSLSPASTEAVRTTNPKWMTRTGWVLTILLSAMLIMSGVMKLRGGKEVEEGVKQSGIPLVIVKPLGIVEIACTIVYLIPQTAVLGAILLTGYMGGAIATHVRLEEDFYIQSIIGVVIWLGIYLRDARLRRLIPLRLSAN